MPSHVDPAFGFYRHSIDDHDGFEADIQVIAGGGGSGTSLPIGDDARVTTPQSYTDPQSGNPVTVLTVPTDPGQTVFAIAYEGEDFPRLAITMSGSDGGTWFGFGDGTDDPFEASLVGIGLLNGAFYLTSAGPSVGLFNSAGALSLLGDPLRFQSAALADGDLAFSADSIGPVIVDQSDGHTYRIISTAGVLSTVQVT